MTLAPDQFGEPGFNKPPSGFPQQGTLFRAPKPTSQWPRGYSPERMAEVKDNVDVIGTSNRAKGYLAGPHGVDRVYQALARSTAPMEEAAPNAFTDASGRKWGQAKVVVRTDLPQGVGGQHYSNMSTGENEVRMASRVDRPNVGSYLMHEMGHNASWRGGRLSALETHRDPSALGAEEGFADDYSRIHDQPDPRDPPKGYTGQFSAYESPDTWKSYTRGRFPGFRGQARTAHRAYLAARTTPLDKDVQNELYKGKLAQTKRDMRRGPNWEEQMPLYAGAEDLHGWDGKN